MVSSPSANKDLTLLVDTESDITIIKNSELKPNSNIDRNEIVSMRGITNERILSFGSILINFIFGHFLIQHKIHIVPDNFPIPSNGILGKDFIKIHLCLIDYGEMTLTIRPNGVASEKTQIFSEVAQNVAVALPNSETFELFHVESDIFPCVLENQEISPGVFVPNSIVTSKECWIRVLNIGDRFAFFPTNMLKTTKTSDYNIFIITQSNHVQNSNNRTEKLKTMLRRNTPAHALDSLTTLCNDFSDHGHCRYHYYHNDCLRGHCI